MGKELVKIGIIGLGRLGLEHARNIQNHVPRAQLSAVCSLVAEELSNANQEFAPQMATQDYHELLNDSSLDGIVIATNSQTHCEIICAAAKAGCKHVFTEKPLGMSMDEVERIKATTEAHPGMLIQ